MKEWKRSKSLIASVLLAVFILTLMPAAAFAEGPETAAPVLEAAPAPAVEAAPAPAVEAAPVPVVETEAAPVVEESPVSRPAAEEVQGPSAPAEDPVQVEPADSTGAEPEGEPEVPAEMEPAVSEEAEAEEASDASAEPTAETAETTETETAGEPEVPAETEPAVSEEAEAEETSDASTDPAALPAEQNPSEEAESTPLGGFVLQTSEAGAEAAAGDASAAGDLRTIEIQIGDHIITATGSFPEGTEIQAVQIPADAASRMSGVEAQYAYDIRLVVNGQVWQPEEHGTDVQLSVKNLDDSQGEVNADIIRVSSDLIDEEGNLSEEALEKTIQDVTADSTETTDTETAGSSFTPGTPSLAATESRVVYVYNATLFDKASGNYPGVYTVKINPNTDTAETAKTTQTIGTPSIADKNLDTPTTESPAIIQGAAVGYEEKTGPTQYTPIEGRTKPEPFTEFTVKVLSEQAADGTTHQKLSGFDGTYVIIRLDVSEFFAAGSGTGTDNLYLHMDQKDNKALMAAATVGKSVAGYVQPTNTFTDGLGNRSASYKLSDLVDDSTDLTTTPYLDVILYATAANVAGADAGKQNAANGDVPLALYIDDKLQYNDSLTDYDPTSVSQSDPEAATKYDQSWHAKYFDSQKDAISHYVVKGSDLALETMVEKTGGTNNQETTYWSLKKSMEDSYYDQEIDKNPDDQGCGRTIKMMSEVAITQGLTLEGAGENSLKKRTLDVNSFDIQVATNTGVEGSSAEDITVKNAWLTIADKSNTTGAEMAIGNNAKFVIDQGGKLIIDETCQLEIEWDGATTTPAADGSTPAQPDILNNGQLDLRAGGEIINNGIITIEGTEGKPVQPGTGQEQQAIDSQKGSGEMTIRQGATLTNNGAFVIYGKLNNLGTLVNNGKYNDVIKSNDPDKGAFDYHKGIQVAWKDDVTQKNIEAGSLTNGEGATLINNGDIVLTPGTLDNKGTLQNNRGGNIYSATATEAIIPITPDPATPTIISKRIKLDPVKLSSIVNSGTLLNTGNIAPAKVALNDNIGFGALTTPGDHPELFSVKNSGTIINGGTIYNNYKGNIVNTGKIYEYHETMETSSVGLLAALTGSMETMNDTWLYLYDDGTFVMRLPNEERLTGTFEFVDEMLVFTMDDGTVVEPVKDEENDWAYSFTSPSGYDVEFILEAAFVAQVHQQYTAQ